MRLNTDLHYETKTSHSQPASTCTAQWRLQIVVRRVRNLNHVRDRREAEPLQGIRVMT
jgi:hypothetical protein